MTAMQRVIAFASACSALAAMAEPSAGLWQFADRGVWILINRDGSAVHCFVDVKGEAFASRGIAHAGYIQWDDTLGRQNIEFRGSQLLVEMYGRMVAYGPPGNAVPPKCRPPAEGSITGLWSRERAYLKVTEEGDAFECRYENGQLQHRIGRIKPPDAIEWAKPEEAETASFVEAGSLTLKSRAESRDFKRSGAPMPRSCQTLEQHAVPPKSQ